MRRVCQLLLPRSACPRARAALLPSLAAPSALATAVRYLSDAGGGDDDDDLEGELASVAAQEGRLASAIDRDGLLRAEVPPVGGGGRGAADREPRVVLEKLDRPPARFDLLTSSLVYRWQTVAAQARKISGPLREWSTELKYRTGVHLELEATYPERLCCSADRGGYATADEVDVTVYLFGSHRGIANCQQLMETMLDEEPMYVRLGVFRRLPGGRGAEWLLLRRINREMRPPDIPPISLKLPGKHTMMFEQYLEAAVRTLWEETGITVDPADVYPTGQLSQSDPQFYWRVPVRYYVAEVPYDVEVRGPQVAPASYVRHWDNRLLRQSPDPIDRAWAATANPETGCAWMPVSVIDELQRPLRGADYMAVRYTPPPHSNLAEVLGFAAPAVEASAGSGAAPAASTAVTAGSSSSADGTAKPEGSTEGDSAAGRAVNTSSDGSDEKEGPAKD